jgi:sugar lactone lactonase YvrE
MKKPGIAVKPLLALMAAVCLGACVSNASKPAGSAGMDGREYYPPLPESPRIQHLVTLASEHDLAGPEDGFARFILGDEKKETRLVQPYGTAMDKGRLYVVDTGAGALAVFDFAKRKLEFLPGSGSGRLKRPINIRIDRDGTRYVTDTGRDQVMVYDRNDRFMLAIGETGQFRPVDLAIVGERLYVVDILHHSVQVLDKASGRLLSHFGKAGSGEGELFHPTNIAVTPEGDVLVVDTSNYRVQRFTAEGKFIRSYGTVGSVPGSFARPKGIAVDPSGRVYVSDAAFENVQLFDREGRLLMDFGQPGEGKEGLNLPTGVTIDRDNVEWFRRFARKGFDIEYLIFVASQFGPNKIDVFGFGRLEGKTYPVEASLVPAQTAERR